LFQDDVEVKIERTELEKKAKHMQEINLKQEFKELLIQPKV